MWKGKGKTSRDKLPKAGNVAGCDIFWSHTEVLRLF